MTSERLSTFLSRETFTVTFTSDNSTPRFVQPFEKTHELLIWHGRGGTPPVNIFISNWIPVGPPAPVVLEHHPYFSHQFQTRILDISRY